MPRSGQATTQAGQQRFGTWLEALRWQTTGVRTAAAQRVILRVLAPWLKWAFRPRISGLERLPRDRPFLLVANHSAGIGLAELGSFAVLWTEAMPPDRALAGFAHPVGFRSRVGRWVHRHLGSAPSTTQAALDALGAGVSLLVFPGGDHECLRPLWLADQVDFAGRSGFLRLARDAHVAIVPMGISGSHYTVPMLLRARWLARLLVLPTLFYGVKRWGLSLLSVLGALLLGALPWPVWLRAAAIWVWLSSPLIFLPLVPASIRFRVGTPLEPAQLFGDDGARPLPQALDEVVARVQELVTG